MRPDRAVVFDLDDTLYPFRRFVLSGFAACARRLARRRGVSSREAFRWMVRAYRGDGRGREIQMALQQLGLPDALTPALVDVIIWGRQLNLRLPEASRQTLAVLRARGWKVGVLTNGHPDVQARKIDALGLARLVDAVVYAGEHGAGKPDPEAFLHIARRLHVAPGSVVVVGDDEWCDVKGALQSGMAAIRFVGHRHWPPGPSAAALTLTDIADVPRAAAALVPHRRQEPYAA